jgi:hypothetical protein
LSNYRLLPILWLAAVVLAACGTGTTGGSDPPAIANATATPLAVITLAPTNTATTVTAEPTPSEPPVQDIKLVATGFSKFKGKYDSGPQLGYGIVVENPNASWIAKQVDLSIAFLDDNGDIIDTVEESFAAILPGQRVAWADTLSDFSGDWSTMKSMEVNLSEPDWEAYLGQPGAYTFSRIKMTRDLIGSIDVTARLKSTFDKELENPQIVALFYRGDKIIGGGWTYLEHARDGAAVKVSTSGYPKVDKVELYGVLTNLSLY